MFFFNIGSQSLALPKGFYLLLPLFATPQFFRRSTGSSRKNKMNALFMVALLALSIVGSEGFSSTFRAGPLKHGEL